MPAPQQIVFTHTDTDTGGATFPVLRCLFAMSPAGGHLGVLRYYPPRHANGRVLVDRLEVQAGSRRRGVGSALEDEMQRLHPDSSLDHGDRTDDGKAWWAGYTADKTVRRGRTLHS